VVFLLLALDDGEHGAGVDGELGAVLEDAVGDAAGLLAAEDLLLEVEERTFRVEPARPVQTCCWPAPM
jgi:hypothetical protein